MKLKVALLSILIFMGCTTIHEQLARNTYLATGRSYNGWTPKKSLCPAFERNGWYNHPPAKDGCFAPPSKVK